LWIANVSGVDDVFGTTQGFDGFGTKQAVRV